MKEAFGRPSPAMGVAIAALIVAVAGTAVATPIAIQSLSKNEKKVVKKIAGKKANKAINKQAPGLSVSHAKTADSATSAKTADSATSAKTADSATSASNLTPPEAFRLVGAGELQNGWVAFGGGGSTPGFYKDQLGVVHLRGEFKDGTSSNNSTGDMFTLPAGYRPAQNQQFQGGDATGSGNIAVLSSGAVRALSGAGNTLLSVDGFTFRAGA